MSERRGPLAGITIIDLTRVLAGPFCTMMLLDLGARVIKVEPPGSGDDARQIGPFIQGKSAYFASLNRGKESIALDLKAPADRTIFEALLHDADVLVENYRGGTMEKLGYGYDALHQRFPRLIYAAASGFGHTGPYRTRPAYDMVVQAMGGIMSLTGHPGQPSARVGSSIGDLCAGLFTALGICAALAGRAHRDAGTKIDVAMLDCQIAILENAIARYFASDEVPGPLGTRHASITPFDAFATEDRPIIIAVGNDALFAILAHALDRADLLQDDRFTSNDRRTTHQATLKAELERRLTTQPAAHWLAILEQAGVPCGPLNNVAEAVADPQIQARNMVVSVEDPEMGVLRMAGNPIKLSGYDDPPQRGPVPRLDGHRQQILAGLRPAS